MIKLSFFKRVNLIIRMTDVAGRLSNGISSNCVLFNNVLATPHVAAEKDVSITYVNVNGAFYLTMYSTVKTIARSGTKIFF